MCVYICRCIVCVHINIYSHKIRLCIFIYFSVKKVVPKQQNERPPDRFCSGSSTLDEAKPLETEVHSSCQNEICLLGKFSKCKEWRWKWEATNTCSVSWEAHERSKGPSCSRGGGGSHSWALEVTESRWFLVCRVCAALWRNESCHSRLKSQNRKNENKPRKAWFGERHFFSDLVFQAVSLKKNPLRAEWFFSGDFYAF